VIDDGFEHRRTSSPTIHLPLPRMPYPLGMPTLQTPRATALMRTPELVTARRIIARPRPITHPRELGPGEQFQLPHADNYPEPQPRSHSRIQESPCQIYDRRHGHNQWGAGDRTKGAIICCFVVAQHSEIFLFKHVVHLTQRQESKIRGPALPPVTPKADVAD
jgi:hypothetical protein